MPVEELLHHLLCCIVLLHQVLPVVVPILCQFSTNSTVHNLSKNITQIFQMIVNHEDQKGRLWWCTNLFWASVAVLAGGRLLLLDPGEPVDLLEPLGHPEHLWEASSHVGYLGHLLAARISRLLRNRECKRSFYAAWQGVDKDSTHFHFFQHVGLSFCQKSNQSWKWEE